MSMFNPKSKEWYQNHDDAARIRENGTEFRAAQQATKALRQGMAGVRRTMKDGTTSNRLSVIMREIIVNGPGLRGQASLEVSVLGTKLKGFQWVSGDPLEDSFNPSHSVSVGVGRDTATWTIPDFSTDTYISKPSRATHFRLVLAIATVSDYTYAPGEGKHVPVDETINGIGETARTAEIPIGGMVGAVTTLTANLPVGTIMPTASALIVSVGIEFYQERQGQYFLLAAKNGMKVMEVA